jgi:hypothetical protein
MRAQMEKDGELESAWTSYNSSLARPLLNTQKFLRKLEKAQAATAGTQTPAPE